MYWYYGQMAHIPETILMLCYIPRPNLLKVTILKKHSKMKKIINQHVIGNMILSETGHIFLKTLIKHHKCRKL